MAGRRGGAEARWRGDAVARWRGDAAPRWYIMPVRPGTSNGITGLSFMNSFLYAICNNADIFCKCLTFVIN